MIFVFGQRFYGKVDAVGPAWVATRFAHVQFLPFVPKTSVLVAGERGLELPLVGRSVAAGYGRVWGPALAVVGAALTQGSSPFIGVPLVVLGAALALWAWIFVGRPRGAARARLDAYASFTGAPVDPALIVEGTRGQTADLANEWLAEITRRAEETIATEGIDLAASYRGSARTTDWMQVAARAERTPPSCQRAALVLARIAWARGESSGEAHDRIWSAISASK
jgi:hypothetical protein